MNLKGLGAIRGLFIPGLLSCADFFHGTVGLEFLAQLAGTLCQTTKPGGYSVLCD